MIRQFMQSLVVRNASHMLVSSDIYNTCARIHVVLKACENKDLEVLIDGV